MVVMKSVEAVTKMMEMVMTMTTFKIIQWGDE